MAFMGLLYAYIVASVPFQGFPADSGGSNQWIESGPLEQATD